MKPVNSYIGTAVARLEDARFLTGRGEYVGDLFPAGLLHAAILRSPVAHGVLKKINIEKANLPGVRAIITAADIAKALGKRERTQAGDQMLGFGSWMAA